jgi:hypothetical protein
MNGAIAFWRARGQPCVALTPTVSGEHIARRLRRHLLSTVLDPQKRQGQARMDQQSANLMDQPPDAHSGMA